MSPATRPSPGDTNRLLVIDPTAGGVRDRTISELPDALRPGDLLVVNDAATLPASLDGSFGGVPVELRLAGPPEDGWAVLFGAGTWRDRTEDRPAPPQVRPGDVLDLGVPVPVLAVSDLSPRLVRVGLPLSEVYRWGRPVQYSYLERDLTLTDVQTPYASRPLAVEMPSAGRPLVQALRESLARRGVGIAALTEAAGLSSTGDPILDAALPLPERYEVPPTTWARVQAADRVVAVGTSVVRALESAARGALRGTTGLVLGADTPLRVVDGLLSGMHEPGESHFQLMGAFADLDLLRRAHDHAIGVGYRNHEFGDSTLLLAG